MDNLGNFFEAFPPYIEIKVPIFWVYTNFLFPIN